MNEDEVKTEGDAFMVVFMRPSDAVLFAVDTQLALVDYDWPAWLVDDGTDPGNWHKDYPHYDGMDLDSYQAPEAICAHSQLF